MGGGGIKLLLTQFALIPCVPSDAVALVFINQINAVPKHAQVRWAFIDL